MKLSLISKLLIFLNILNFFDLIFTIIGINRFGLVVESNQLIVFIVSNFGYGFLILFKVGFLLVGSFILKNSYQKTDFKIIKNLAFSVVLISVFVYYTVVFEWVVFLF